MPDRWIMAWRRFSRDAATASLADSFGGGGASAAGFSGVLTAGNSSVSLTDGVRRSGSGNRAGSVLVDASVCFRSRDPVGATLGGGPGGVADSSAGYLSNDAA